MTTAERRQQEKKLMDRYKARAKRAKSDNMKKMLSFWADYHEDMMDDLGELIELRAKAVSG
jgi:hypothetical protein